MYISLLQSDSINHARANRTTHIGIQALGESQQKLPFFVSRFTFQDDGVRTSGNGAKLSAGISAVSYMALI